MSEYKEAEMVHGNNKNQSLEFSSCCEAEIHRGAQRSLAGVGILQPSFLYLGRGLTVAARKIPRETYAELLMSLLDFSRTPLPFNVIAGYKVVLFSLKIHRIPYSQTK